MASVKSSFKVTKPVKVGEPPGLIMLLPMMLVFAAELAWTMILLVHVFEASPKRAAVAVPVVSPKKMVPKPKEPLLVDAMTAPDLMVMLLLNPLLLLVALDMVRLDVALFWIMPVTFVPIGA